MPSVDVAMARSLRGGVWGSVTDHLASSLGPALVRRDIVGQVNDVKTAFSSWDNCMQAAYCKWPVIAIIIIGGLIIFSIVWCIVRCACCGLSCCCQCCQCLKCCGECCGMCDPPKGRPHKYLDEPYTPNQPYRSQAPMKAPFAQVPSHEPEPPQYAEFDVSKKNAAGAAHEDALPAMPSWENANSKKVLVEEAESVELAALKKQPESSQTVPLMSGGISPGPSSPMHPDNRSPYGQSSQASPYGQPGHVSPYGQQQLSPNDLGRHSPYGQPGMSSSSGYLGVGGQHSDPYSQGDAGYNASGSSGYGPSSSPPGADPYNSVGALATSAARRSPRPDYNGSHGLAQPNGGYASSQQSQGYNQYDHSGQQGYGMGPGRRSPPRTNTGASSAYNDRMRHSPAPISMPEPHTDGYGIDEPYDRTYEQPSRSNTGGALPRPYPPGPQRQYTDPQRPIAARAGMDRAYSPNRSPNLQNNAGFDFNSGYSRPQQEEYGRRPTVSPQQPQNGANYSGYRGYRA